MLTYLGSLTPYFPSTGQGTMDFTCGGKGKQVIKTAERPHRDENKAARM